MTHRPVSDLIEELELELLDEGVASTLRAATQKAKKVFKRMIARLRDPSTEVILKRHGKQGAFISSNDQTLTNYLAAALNVMTYWMAGAAQPREREAAAKSFADAGRVAWSILAERIGLSPQEVQRVLNRLVSYGVNQGHDRGAFISARVRVPGTEGTSWVVVWKSGARWRS